MAKVGIIMGSDSDLPVMKAAGDILDELEVGYEYTICSAHRLPKETAAYAEGAIEKGFDVIIAGAGGAAHLAGVIASHTVLPVIGVPILSDALSGNDALYSMVQMPKGIPVACVALNGAANAALLAVEILAVADPDLRKRLYKYRSKMAAEVREKDSRLKRTGVEVYLRTKGVK